MPGRDTGWHFTTGVDGFRSAGMNPGRAWREIPYRSFEGAPVIERARTAIAIAYVRCNLVAAMPKLSLNNLPRSKLSDALCHVVRAFGIHPRFV